ncbi:hypothetical protein PEP31012_02051 [Pandoraea eparura]|uniref:T6SS immunity protein Tdi1 C-terminal domain-containing protein n=1 Tax=Pandoraea eparura TaxID=2508291 RepID=A0A5E4UHZ2_9BURK|nr:hypothetical protein [Pandoraea eparura]VVD99640.1 hypothetical protein PEP31012_02051 [Pandoraea eparura]
MTKLSWRDIFVEGVVLEGIPLAQQWPHTLTGRLRLIGASAFGDLFFERLGGGVETLDVLEGGVRKVASSTQEFASLMNNPTWQAESLLTDGVALLFERGVHRNDEQFFAFAPHPILAGKILWDRVMPMDAIVWHSICAQLLDRPV